MQENEIKLMTIEEFEKEYKEVIYKHYLYSLDLLNKEFKRTGRKNYMFVLEQAIDEFPIKYAYINRYFGGNLFKDIILSSLLLDSKAPWFLKKDIRRHFDGKRRNDESSGSTDKKSS